jgi:hypothetical protein
MGQKGIDRNRNEWVVSFLQLLYHANAVEGNLRLAFREHLPDPALISAVHILQEMNIRKYIFAP